GADTPFAKYIRGKYPPVKLEGVTINEAESPTEVAGGETTNPMPGGLNVPMPMGPSAGGTPTPGGMKGKLPGTGGQPPPAGGSDGGAMIEARPLKDYPKPFVDRVLGKVNPFNVYGVDIAAEQLKQGAPGYPGTVPGTSPMGMGYPKGFQPG